MRGPMCQYAYPTRWYLGIVIALALGSALGSQAAAAKECHRVSSQLLIYPFRTRCLKRYHTVSPRTRAYALPSTGGLR